MLIYVKLVPISRLLRTLHLLFAANPCSKPHFSMVDNLSNSSFENVYHDGRFRGSTATLTGCLSPQKQGK
jgi:hypothetical protein